VQTADDLLPAWFDCTGTVGITAGTSTPDDVIDAVEARLRSIACAAEARAVNHSVMEIA
jgi:4-hydroxy-3-methylbut-2-enyl diphosphate reductase IspH